MVSRLAAFVIWALVAATAVFWGLRLLVSAPAAPSYAVAVGDAGAVRADLSRVLGSAPSTTTAAAAAPETSSRFKLLGIMAPRGTTAGPGEGGVALIAVDGKAPKAFVVGARLDDGLVLQSVSLRTASIGPAQGAASMKLELPALPPPATGTLPAPGTSSTAGPASPPPSTNPAFAPPPRSGVAVPAPMQPPMQAPVVSPPPMQTPQQQPGDPSAPPSVAPPPGGNAPTR
jgi:general secretion pathway protein C